MKNIILLFFIFSIYQYNLFSAEDNAYFRAKQGDNALLFTLTGLSNLSASNFGSGLGYQYYFANHLAYRLSLGMNFDEETTEKPQGAEEDYTKSMTDFGLSQAIRYNFAGYSGNVLAYIGAELLLSLSKEVEEGVSFQPITSITRRINYGAGVIIGAEWFPWKNVSLSAEYHLTFKYSTGKNEITAGNNTQETNKPTLTGLHLGASSANFIISRSEEHTSELQ